MSPGQAKQTVVDGVAIFVLKKMNHAKPQLKDGTQKFQLFAVVQLIQSWRVNVSRLIGASGVDQEEDSLLPSSFAIVVREVNNILMAGDFGPPRIDSAF